MSFLSIIIPTYNSESTISQCLESLLLQSFQDFEVCIVDGASSDKTIEIVHTYYSKFRCINVISEPDKGVYDAMNKGIDISSGKWLYFLGSDDTIYDAEVLSDLIGFINSGKFELIYGNVCMWGRNLKSTEGSIYGGVFDIDRLTYQNICHQAIFYQKDLFRRFGKYKTKYPIYGDWEMNVRLSSTVNFTYFDRLIANYSTEGLSNRNISDPFQRELRFVRMHLLIKLKIGKWLSLKLRFLSPTSNRILNKIFN
jgi:glycosyltransferase involved in cell wall biosynthesis